MPSSLRVSSGRPALWLVLAFLLTGLSTHAQAPAWQTAAAAAGTVTVMGTDTDGTSVYVVGNFSGTATFGSTTLTATGSQELFAAKWSIATSSFVWALQGTSTGTGSNSANAVVVGGGYVFMTGSFSTTTLKLGSTTALTNAQAGTSDIFLVRLTDNGSSGAFATARRAGGTGNDYANAIAYAGSVFVGGSNSASAAFGTYTVPTAGGYIAAYSLGGTPSAAPVAMGASVSGLATSPAPASLYAAGSFTSANSLFGNGSYQLTSAGGTDAFVARLSASSSPQFAWVQGAGGASNDYANAVQATGSRVYVAGTSASASATYGSTTLTNAGGGVAFVAKLADTPTAGTFAWAVQNGAGTSAYNSANALSATGNSIYLAGTFGGTVSLGTTTLTSAGLSDVLLSKLTDNGSTATLNWVQQAGGAGLDQANGVTRAATQVFAAGTVTPPAAFGSLSIGTAAGARPGFLAAVADPAPLLALAAPNAGAVGSTTALYGLNLAGATSITFAGTTGNVVTSGFTVNAAGTVITGVVVPSGAQSGGIIVTTPQGTSNGAVNFTLVPAASVPPTWQTLNTTTSTSSVRWAQPDASGNIIVTGEFTGTLTLGSTTLTSAGVQDVFVAKLNPTTNAYVWAVRAGSSAYDGSMGLVVTANGIYLAAQFDGLNATLGGLTLTSAAGYASFVAKLTDAGSSASFTWAQLIDDSNAAYIEALAVSGSSVYISGEHVGTPLNLGTGTLTGNASSDDGFLAKFTDNGTTATFNWATALGSPGAIYSNTISPYGLAVRGNTVYLAGTLYGTVTVGGYTLTSNATDAAIVRFTDAGTSATITAAINTGSTGSDFVNSMVGQGSALYISGQTIGGTWPGTSGPGSGSYAAFVLKVTDTGASLAYTWVQLLGGPYFAFANQLAVNGTSIYTAGTFTNATTFGSLALLGAGSSDGFVAKLTDAGSSVNLAWVQAVGGASDDYLHALALRPGQVYAGGSLTPLAACGPLAVLTPVGTSVAALASLNDATVLAAAPATAAGGYYLYPNPAHGTTTVQLPSGGTAGLSLLDALGREVRRYPATTAAEATLDLQGVPAGLYVLRGAGRTGHKLVVE